MWLQIPYTQIDWAFTKWFIGWYNQINVPASYSTYLRNCRIENESIIMRDWFRAYTWIDILWKYRKLKNVWWELYALIQPDWSKKVRLYHLLPNNYYNLWNVWSVNSEFTKKDDVDIVAIWDMALILWKWHRPQYSIKWTSIEELNDAEMVNIDGWTAVDDNFSSCMWAYYSSNVFINEVQADHRTREDEQGNITTWVDYKKTNRVIVSHFVNMDTKDRRKNARDFSAQRQKLWNNETQSYDETEIPYKIVCPTTVTGIIWTMQNLYIFCEDSIQYLDQTILQEYWNSKTLRTVPIANWYQLDNHHLATAAGNFVFFFSRDKHIRTIGYTSGIYDPQIADLTDTEFGIQRWINDNIADDQSDGFAFFNKKDQNVEFHLTSKKAYANWNSIRNDITLIRDLQHQAWLIDTGKYFGAMENFDRPWTATWSYAVAPWYDDGWIPDTLERSGIAVVVAWWTWLAGYRPTTQDLDWSSITAYETWQFYYQTEDKYDTTFRKESWEIIIDVHAIEFEYDTTNIGLVWNKTELAEMKLFSGARLTWAINIHAGNTQTVYVPQTQTTETYEGNFKVTVYIDWVKQCEKKLERQNIYDYYKKYQIEVWWPDLKPYDPTDRKSVLEYDRLLFPMDLVLDQSMIRKKGKRIRLKIECATPGADLYLSGLAIQAKQLGHFDLADKY